MSRDMVAALDEVIAELGKGEHLLSLIARELAELRHDLDKMEGASPALEQPVQGRVKAEDLEAEHRRAHRPGNPSRLDTDPELNAFVLARIDTHTFPQLEEEIAAHFPPERRIGKSAIHRWWQRRSTPKA